MAESRNRTLSLHHSSLKVLHECGRLDSGFTLKLEEGSARLRFTQIQNAHPLSSSFVFTVTTPTEITILYTVAISQHC